MGLCTTLVYLFVYLHQGTMAQSRKPSTENNVNPLNPDHTFVSCKDMEERLKLLKGYRTPYKEDQSKRMCLQHALNALFQEPEKFTKSDLDNICKVLKSRAEELGTKVQIQNKCKWGTGNYDVTVLAEALRQEGAYEQWLSKKQFQNLGAKLFDDEFLCAPPESDNTGDVSAYKFLGFILNVPSSGRLGISRHWKTVKKIKWSEDAPKFEITNQKKSANDKRRRNRRAGKSMVLHKSLASKLDAEEWYDLDSKLNDSKKMLEEDVMDLLSTVIKENGQIIVCRQKVVEMPLPQMPEMDVIEQKMEEMKWDANPETQTDTIAPKVGSRKNTDTTDKLKKGIVKDAKKGNKRKTPKLLK